MKKIFAAVFSLVLLLAFSGCEKCYKCHNLCKTCTYTYTNFTDTTLTIKVCSEKLSAAYFKEYTDSLQSPSLGWVCTDAASNNTLNFCGSKSSNIVNLVSKKEQGWVCAGE